MAKIEIENLAVPPWIDLKPYIPEVKEEERIRSCVILGSFGKFHQQINETICTLEKNDITVLAPKHASIIDNQEFQILETDRKIMDDLRFRYPEVSWTKDHFAAVIEKIFKLTIDEAGFVYIVNPNNIISPDGSPYPNGYAGIMMAGEIGHAMSAKKPIYSWESLDPTLDEKEGIIWPSTWKFVAECIKPYSPEEVISMVDEGMLDEKDYFWCDGYKPKDWS